MKRLAFLYVIAFVVVSAQAVVIFEDDFEDGTLNKWTIDGRQQGTSLAEVVEIQSNKMAHLQHKGFTEITIEKIFTYSSLLNFEFDFKSVVSSSYGPHDDDFSAGYFIFRFLNESGSQLGWVMYARSSSDYLFNYYNPFPECEVFEISDNNIHTYSLNASDLLSNLEIDYSSVKSVRFGFAAGASGTSSSLISDVWVDDVTITPEPATLLLLAVGSLAVLRKKLS
jgi:hypothetical protein